MTADGGVEGLRLISSLPVASLARLPFGLEHRLPQNFCQGTSRRSGSLLEGCACLDPCNSRCSRISTGVRRCTPGPHTALSTAGIPSMSCATPDQPSTRSAISRATFSIIANASSSLPVASVMPQAMPDKEALAIMDKVHAGDSSELSAACTR